MGRMYSAATLQASRSPRSSGKSLTRSRTRLSFPSRKTSFLTTMVHQLPCFTGRGFWNLLFAILAISSGEGMPVFAGEELTRRITPTQSRKLRDCERNSTPPMAMSWAASWNT